MSEPPETREAPIRPDAGEWISGTAQAVPLPNCARCEDWTTVVHSATVVSPCPVCRPAEYEAWLAAGHILPDRASAA